MLFLQKGGPAVDGASLLQELVWFYPLLCFRVHFKAPDYHIVPLVYGKPIDKDI